jgi:G:T/U-mismatch repair DNA glycosylase
VDTSITEEVANDFPAFFEKYPNISDVYFNGSKAETVFRHRVLLPLAEDRLIFTRLPSSSPALATMTLEAKVHAWSLVRKLLSS